MARSKAKVRLSNRGDGSYTVHDGRHLLGFVRKLTARRWICAPFGTGQIADVEVTEHDTRRMAVRRLTR